MTEQSILAAVSGIKANQTYLDSIGNNIANVNTVGFKAGQLQFQSLLAQQLSGASAPTTGTAGINPVAVGSGVRVSGNQLNLSEGSLEATGVNTDVAIQGSGYLVVQQGGQQLYTRDGALTPDANGNLATQGGGLVQGWTANSQGQINTSAPLSSIKIPTGATVGAKATTEQTLGGNLPVWNGTGTPPSVSPTTYNAYDSLGNTVPVTVTYTAVSGQANQWMLTATVPDPATGKPTAVLGTIGPPPAGGPTVSFDPSTGQVKSVSGITANSDGSYSIPMTMPSTGYNFPSGYKIDLNVPAPNSSGAVTQFNSPSSIQVENGDGHTAGTLASYSIGNDGTITGSFSNGTTLALGQIALASFSNPGGLTNQGGGQFAASPNSGQALVGAPGSGGRGTLLGGELEQSNVDLGTELTNLITAQEAYTANTKVLTATNMSIQALEAVQ